MLDPDSGPEELAFLPGPLHAGLFETSDADSGVVMVPLPPVEVGMICAARRLAIDTAALPYLFAECHAAWRADSHRCRARALAAAGDSTRGLEEGEGGGAVVESDADVKLERSSRCIVLLTLGQNYTAWADRRRRLLRIAAAERSSGQGRGAAGKQEEGVACNGIGAPSPRLAVELARELALSELVLRSFSKSHETYLHRRWLLTMCVRVGGLSVGGGDSGGDAGGDEDSKGAVWFAREQAAKEAAICQGAMAKRKSNYHAARHFAQACIGRLRSIRSPAGAEHLGAAGAAGASVSASALAQPP